MGGGGSPLSFTHAVNFGTPAGIGLSQYLIDRIGPQPSNDLKIRVKVTAVDANTVAIEMRVEYPADNTSGGPY